MSQQQLRGGRVDHPTAGLITQPAHPFTRELYLELLEEVKGYLGTWEGCDCACEPAEYRGDVEYPAHTCTQCRLKDVIARAEGRA